MIDRTSADMTDRAGHPDPEPRLEPNMTDPDGFYEQLLAAHEGLSTEASFELNARLLLLLANQVGDPGILARCIALAREAGRGAKLPAGPGA